MRINCVQHGSKQAKFRNKIVKGRRKLCCLHTIKLCIPENYEKSCLLFYKKCVSKGAVFSCL